MGLTIDDSGYWIYIVSEEKPSYVITGKYLFFSEIQDRLIEIAKNEIRNFGFHRAKVNSRLLGSNTDYVLCLYYQDDGRKYELADRHSEQYSDTKYRYWKSDKDTLKGKYSEEFISKLDRSGKQHFTTDKTKEHP